MFRGRWCLVLIFLVVLDFLSVDFCALPLKLVILATEEAAGKNVVVLVVGYLCINTIMPYACSDVFYYSCGASTTTASYPTMSCSGAWTSGGCFIYWQKVLPVFPRFQYVVGVSVHCYGEGEVSLTPRKPRCSSIPL